MNVWHPAPRGLVIAASTERWTKDRPAPQLVVYLWIWSQRDDGENPTRRQVARLFGWTEHYARLMVDRVRTEHQEWVNAFSPETRKTNHPASRRTDNNLREQIAQNKPAITQISPDRAREFTSQSNSHHTQFIELDQGVGKWHRRK
jgi:hypothetical protein